MNTLKAFAMALIVIQLGLITTDIIDIINGVNIQSSIFWIFFNSAFILLNLNTMGIFDKKDDSTNNT